MCPGQTVELTGSVLNFYCSCLKMQRVNAELKGFCFLDFICSWETQRQRQRHRGKAGSLWGARCRTQSQDPRIPTWAKGRCSMVEPPRCPDLKSLEVDSLVIEHIQVNKAPEMRHRTNRAHGQINPQMTLPATSRWFLLKKSRLFLNQKRRLHRSKRYPRRNWRNKSLWPQE